MKKSIACLLLIAMIALLAACAGPAKDNDEPSGAGTQTSEPGTQPSDADTQPSDPGTQSVGSLVTGDWWDDLPRESWSQFEKVDVGDDWFSVYKLPKDVYAIYEDGQWEEVICYLILGSDRALLWDTGMGMGNVRAVVDKLTELPYSVLLSHHHHDHMGGISQFADKEIYCYDSETMVDIVTNGLPVGDENLLGEIGEGSFWKEYPEGFDPDTYEIKGVAPAGTVKDGDIIDLGGRKLEVVFTPGHAADCIMLIDEENGVLFTGDMYYPAELFAFSEDSDIDTYVKSLRAIVEKIDGMGIEWVYTSHNETVKGTQGLIDAADAMESILNGEATDYEVNEEGLRTYSFDNGIVIITQDE